MEIKDIPHLQKHTQIIHFDNGEERVIRDVAHIENGRWTHIFTDGDGHGAKEVIVNPDRVLFIRVLKSEMGGE